MFSISKVLPHEKVFSPISIVTETNNGFIKSTAKSTTYRQRNIFTLAV
jgi:hypothetical protein